ncbi:MAG: 50S ribosomal protein L23 [Candidatus Aminicenantes bacterium]|nr:50S ribosomal protein L23 [Candidatus Aminicenantes bacterium]
MKLDARKIIIRPVITEKATRLKDEERTMVFEVHPKANKVQIKQAVEEIFKVKVEAVRIVKMKGKTRRLRFRVGKTKDWKKAYVKLREGEKMIEFIEAV